MQIVLISVLKLMIPQLHNVIILMNFIVYNSIIIIITGTMLNLQHTVLEEIVTNDIALNFTESVLEICAIELEESGEYSCTASNGISTATVNNTANLTVIPGLCVCGGGGGGRRGYAVFILT